MRAFASSPFAVCRDSKLQPRNGEKMGGTRVAVQQCGDHAWGVWGMKIGGERKRSGRQGRGISLLQVVQRSLEPFMTLLPSQCDALISQGLSDFQSYFKVYFKAVLSSSAHLCPLQSVDIFLESQHITILL